MGGGGEERKVVVAEIRVGGVFVFERDAAQGGELLKRKARKCNVSLFKILTWVPIKGRRNLNMGKYYVSRWVLTRRTVAVACLGFALRTTTGWLKQPSSMSRSTSRRLSHWYLGRSQRMLPERTS